MDITVVIATYNRADRIGFCLEALECQTVKPRVVVADDGSEDDTFETIQDYASYDCALKVEYAWHKHDGWGLARTRNMGARLAGGHLWFIDSDILLNPRAIENGLRLLEENPNRVIGGYFKYLPGMRITHQSIRQWTPIWEMTLPTRQVLQELTPIGKDVREAWHDQGRMPDLFADESAICYSPLTLVGGSILVPRHIWEEVGPFEERFTFYGGEDGEYSLKCAEKGYGFSFSRSMAGCHMAHPKEPTAVHNEARVMALIRELHPRWFRGEQAAWCLPDWEWPVEKKG